MLWSCFNYGIIQLAEMAFWEYGSASVERRQLVTQGNRIYSRSVSLWGQETQHGPLSLLFSLYVTDTFSVLRGPSEPLMILVNQV